MSNEELLEAMTRAIEKQIPETGVSLGDIRDAAIDALAICSPTIEALRAENARLLEALKPFANLAADEDNGTASEAEMWFVFGAGKHVTIGDLRAARAAMGETE